MAETSVGRATLHTLVGRKEQEVVAVHKVPARPVGILVAALVGRLAQGLLARVHARTGAGRPKARVVPEVLVGERLVPQGPPLAQGPPSRPSVIPRVEAVETVPQVLDAIGLAEARPLTEPVGAPVLETGPRETLALHVVPDALGHVRQAGAALGRLEVVRAVRPETHADVVAGLDQAACNTGLTTLVVAGRLAGQANVILVGLPGLLRLVPETLLAIQAAKTGGIAPSRPALVTGRGPFRRPRRPPSAVVTQTGAMEIHIRAEAGRTGLATVEVVGRPALRPVVAAVAVTF